jgi:hypothetical protein
MKILSYSIALIAVLALPLAAQQMGSSNRNAPKVAQHIEFHNGAKLEISYTALNWADGKFAENVKNERFREMVNTNAKEKPVGSVALTAPMTVAGRTVAAGSYGLHFLLSDDGRWILTLSHKNEEGDVELIQWPLMLKDAPSHAQRLTILVSAGKEVTECNVHLHFGDKHLVVPASLVTEDK